jgi:S-DNA-T family DNA segregation ATPase FtsK/SpoIIIE
MLAADNLMLKLPHLGRKAWGRRGDLPAMIGALGLHNRAAVAESGAMTASPRAAVAVPASMGAAVRTPPSQSRRLAPPIAPPRPPAVPMPAEPAPRPQKRTNSKYNLPPADLLAEPTGGYIESQEAHAAEKREILQQTLSDFNVAAEVVGHMTGPVITLFELSVAPGVKVAQISSLATDIARALAVPGVRVVSPIPGKDTVGIEVPNMDKEIVRIKELMVMAPEADKRMHIPLYLGKDAGGGAIVADLATMPHLLIAGTTGSGKSVSINSIIMAILMTRLPEEVRLILADPKMVEMAAFENIPHLLCPIITDMRKAEDILEWAVGKMDERYELLKDANVKNIASFNRLGADELYKRLDIETDEERARITTHMPYYVIIIDELADLIMTSSKEVEGHIIRIAQKARAVGIHLILATQRPSVNVVTGLIKSNMPCRISFRVASRQESRIVLDQNGADVLLGRGDMLFLQPGDSNLVRAQGTFVDDSEIHSVVQTLHGSAGDPQFNSELMQIGSPMPGEGGGDRDELFNQGVEIVLATQRGSVSLLQRRLQVGYSRASRIIDQMADAGILGDYKGSQAREWLITLEDWQELQESIRRDQSGDASIDGEPTSA